MSKNQSSTLGVILRFFFNYVVFAFLVLEIALVVICNSNIKNLTPVWENGASTQATVK